MIPIRKDISNCHNSKRISEETAHQVGRDSTGYMATHQEMRVPILKSSLNSCKSQLLKRIPISLLNREDATSLMQPTSPGSRKFTMPQRSALLIRTLLKNTAKDAITSTLRTSRCHHSNLSSWTRMKRTALLQWRTFAKTTPASLLRSWTSKSGPTYFHPPLACRCASECYKPLVYKDNPILANMNSENVSECLTHFIGTRKKAREYCILYT